MEEEQSKNGEPAAGSRERWLVTYAIGGDLRYLSHHDTLRMFVRAITRAGLPVRYTRGFNPRPKVSNPLPLPVGVSSEAETLIIEFTEPMAADGLIGRLSPQLPVGVTLTGARRLERRESFSEAVVVYRLDVGDPFRPGLASSLDRVRGSDTLPVERVVNGSGSRRTVDVRPYLAEVQWDGAAVRFALRVTGAGTARPAEIAGLLGFNPVSVNHDIQRITVQWE